MVRVEQVVIEDEEASSSWVGDRVLEQVQSRLSSKPRLASSVAASRLAQDQQTQ